MDSEQSRTGLRNVLLRFAGDQPKETVDMLEKAGGKGVMDKFDMVGESFPQALQNFNELMQKLDEKSKNTVLSQMFGRENIAPAMTLLSNVPELMKNIALQGDKTILAKGVAIGTGGEAAQANRMANTEQLELMERQKQEFQKEMLVKAFELEARKMGTPELGVQAMSTGIRGLNSLGVDPKETIHNLMRTSGLALGASSQDQRNVGGFVDAMFNRAESFGEGSEITPMNVAGPQMPFVRQSTPFRGQKISIFDNEEADNLKDEKKDAALELAKARAEATSPDSPGGVKITQGEKEIIDSLRALVAATNIQTLELKKRTRNVDAGNE
jgi:hypothetical protein